MGKNRVPIYTLLGFSLVLSLAVAVMVSCGGNSTTSSNSTTGTVQTLLSDPPTCSLDFDHVYVTITKVEANISATSNSGWQTLVDLTSTPKQVDLLSLNPSVTPNFCGTLYMLGTKALPPGKYQQIRLILMPNTGTVSGNQCSTGVNCVVPHNSTSTYELQLSSQAQTGIKIPASQISNGGLTVSAGQSVDFNINFDTCASIVQEGINGPYRFKPVLHAGEISTNGANTISGKVVEGTGSPNPGMGIGNAVVLLEQPDTSTTPPTDRVVWGGLTNSDGTFAFCPVASSTANYDVVVAGSTTQTNSGVTTTTTYNPSVVFNVPVGGATGSVPLFAEATSGSGTGPATIAGQITTSGSSTVGGDVQLSALQSVMDGSNPVNITVPVFQSTSAPTGNVTTNSQPPIYTTVSTTSANGGCASGSTDCVGYSIMVPASTAAVGTYDSSSGNNVTAPSSTNSATYTINGLADGSTNTTLNDTLLTCSPTNENSSAINVAPGQSVDQNTSGGSSLVLNFTGCTAPTP